jgi:tetratricopeptide (TPR) repeat protein
LWIGKERPIDNLDFKNDEKCKSRISIITGRQINNSTFIKNDSLLFVYTQSLDSTINHTKIRLDNLQSYNELVKSSNDFLARERIYISLLISLIALTSIVVGLWGTIGLKYSFDDKVSAIKSESEKQIKEFRNRFELFKEESDKTLISFKDHLMEQKKITIYQLGMNSFNKKDFSGAMYFFQISYNSDYRLNTTTYYLGVCCMQEKNKKSALKYLNEAKSLNINNSSLMNEIQKEIDKVESEIANENTTFI